MLCVMGTFGTSAFSVSKRLRELGICIALGAQRKEILQAALGGRLRLLTVGSAAGSLLGVLEGRLLFSRFIKQLLATHFCPPGVALSMSLWGCWRHRFQRGAPWRSTRLILVPEE